MRRLAPLAAALLLAVPFAGCLDVADNRWAAAATQLDGADEAAPRLARVRIAVLDTGVDTSHPALRHLTDGDPRNGELVASRDFAGSDRKADAVGHGTFVASLLAARPPQGLAGLADAEARIRGLLPPVQLLSARVCASERCDLRQLDDALAWAVEEGADVAVLSLGFRHQEVVDSPDAVERVRRALARAEESGMVVVAAAGNAGRLGVLFPASEPTVLAVGAVDRDLRVRASSAHGSGKPDVVAPGEGILGAWLGGGQVALDGTSAAAPFVAAAAALLLASDPRAQWEPSAAAVREAIRSAAWPVLRADGRPDAAAGPGLLRAQDARSAFADARGTASRTQSP